MLAHCHHTAIFQTTGKGDGMTCHQLGTLTEGASADNGILGIVVHVEYRGKIHLDAHAAALACHLAAVLIQQHVVVDSPQDEVALEVGYFFQAHSQAPFAVDGNHQGDGSQ